MNLTNRQINVLITEFLPRFRANMDAKKEKMIKATKIEVIKKLTACEIPFDAVGGIVNALSFDNEVVKTIFGMESHYGNFKGPFKNLQEMADSITIDLVNAELRKDPTRNRDYNAQLEHIIVLATVQADDMKTLMKVLESKIR